ncbi:hypothetical protein ACFLZ7_04280 [Nanoarchaeota archaeon]
MKPLSKLLLFIFVLISLSQIVLADTCTVQGCVLDYYGSDACGIDVNITDSGGGHSEQITSCSGPGYSIICSSNGGYYQGQVTCTQSSSIIISLAYDGTYFGNNNATAAATTTISVNMSETWLGVLPPNITIVNVPTSVNEGDWLNVSFGADDPDNLTLTYYIYRNGTLISTTNESDWLTNYTVAGDWNYSFFVNNTGGGSDEESRIITVNNTNRAPSITVVNAPTSVNEGDWLNVSFGATDLDGDALTYYIYRNGTLVNSTNQSSWLTNYTSVGSYNYTFYVNDTYGTYDLDSRIITITNTNRAPNITLVTAPTSVNEGDAINVSFTVDDLDTDDTLYYYIYRNGTLVSNTSSNGWLTNYTSVGSYNYTFFVNDTHGASDTESRIITINNTNRAPNITLITAPTSIDEGDWLNVSFTVNDPDTDDTLYYHIYRNGTLVSSTNESTWLTNYTTAGQYNYTFYVNDTYGASDLENRTIIVNETILIITAYDIYSPGVPVTIIGVFGPSVLVNLSILNASNVSVYSDQQTCTADGNATFLWPNSGTPYGNYTLVVHDVANPAHNSSRPGMIIPPFGFVATGELFDYNLSFVNGTVYLKHLNGTIVAVDDGQYNFTLDWGREYIFDTEPDLPGLERVTIVGIANEGDSGDVLGVDEPPSNQTIGDKNVTFDQVVAFFPAIENYDFINITINHSASDLFAAYKCLSWNFTERTCAGGNWTKVKYIEEGEGLTTITFYPGDPGASVGSTCGDGELDPGETCGNCPADACPIVTLISPQNNTDLNYPTVNFTFNVTSAFPLESCDLVVDNVINKTTTDVPRNETNNITSWINIGQHDWSINCIDNESSTGNSTIYNLTLTDITPPWWDPLPTSQTANEKTLFSYDVNATDDFGVYTYSVNDSSFNINSDGLITNATGLGVGVYWLNISVNDTSGNQNFTVINITIADITNPSVSTIQPTSIDEDSAINYNATVSDNVNVTSCNLFIGGVLNGSMNIVGSIASRTVTVNTPGNYQILANCSDAAGNYNDTSVTSLNINDVTPPTWDQTPSNQVVEYPTSLIYDVNASDNSAIDSYFVNDSKFDIDSSGVITNATSLSVGIYSVNISVNDTSNNLLSILITITVQDTLAPTWDQTPTDQTARIDRVFSYDVNATDPSGIDQYFINDTTNFAINSSTGEITNATGLSLGNYSLNISVNDTYGKLLSTIITITVLVADTSSPVISNVDSTTTNETATITWTTDDPSNSTAEYWIPSSSALSTTGSALVTSHSISLIGLQNFTLYYYNLTSCNEYGNCSTSGPYYFITEQNVPPTTVVREVEVEVRRRSPSTGIVVMPCSEDWTCSDWTACQPDGTQTRSCYDSADCGTDLFMPEEVQSCEYEAEVRVPAFKMPSINIRALLDQIQASLTIWMLALFALIIVAITVIATISLRRKQEEVPKAIPEIKPTQTEPASAKPDVSADDALAKLNALKAYVTYELDQGFSKEEVIKKLQENGWPENIINSLLK